jgi:hypothetical protein
MLTDSFQQLAHGMWDLVMCYTLLCSSLLKSLSYCRAVASSEVSSAHSAIQCSVVQFPLSSLFSLRSSSSCLHLLACFPITSVFPSTFPLMAWCRKQLLHRMWPNQLAFVSLIVCRIFLSVFIAILLHFSHDQSIRSSPSLFSTTFQNFPCISDLLSKMISFSTVHSSALSLTLTSFSLKFKFNLLVLRAFCLLNAAYASYILSSSEDIMSIYDDILTNCWHFNKMVWFIK